jgi:hypothetical protein
MITKINLNEYVKIKLTDKGILILKQQHDELNKQIQESGGKGTTFNLKLDERGYYEGQLWSVIQKFGKYIGICEEPPFESDIIFETKF